MRFASKSPVFATDDPARVDARHLAPIEKERIGTARSGQTLPPTASVRPIDQTLTLSLRTKRESGPRSEAANFG